MSILDRFFKKKGIETSEDLSAEERVVYENYKRILTGENLTVDSIKEFCSSQIKIIESRIAASLEIPSAVQVASLHVYLNILKMMDAPEVERRTLEDYLTQQINER